MKDDDISVFDILKGGLGYSVSHEDEEEVLDVDHVLFNPEKVLRGKSLSLLPKNVLYLFLVFPSPQRK